MILKERLVGRDQDLDSIVDFLLYFFCSLELLIYYYLENGIENNSLRSRQNPEIEISLSVDKE